MEKGNLVNSFNETVDQLRTKVCNTNEKVLCFQRIAECITSPLMAAQMNYATYVSRACNVLLLFCEDLDSSVCISAEQNLNRIFRVLERTRVSRILMDLYGEIKRNGNQRSLRICLRIFGYYAPQIREHHVCWYAQHLLPCLPQIAKRKETQLQESLADFVQKFAKYILPGLTDNETCKLFEVFIDNIKSDCVVKRRCAGQNCALLVEHANNKELLAKYALNKVIEILSCDQQPDTIKGVLGFVRQLIPTCINIFHKQHSRQNDDYDLSYYNSKCQHSIVSQQILEIYDYCLYLISSLALHNHTLINACLEVVYIILQCIDGVSEADDKYQLSISTSLKEFMAGNHLIHSDYLQRNHTLKHQILNFLSFDETDEFQDNSSNNNLQNRTKDTRNEGTILQSQNDTISLPILVGEQRQAQISQEEQDKSTNLLRNLKTRSISESGIIDDNDIGLVGDVGKNVDSDGFSLMSEINEKPDSLVNLTAATTNASNATQGKNEKLNEEETIVNELGDDLSNQLSNTIDNESVTSAEFNIDNTRGLVIDGVDLCHKSPDNDDINSYKQHVEEDKMKLLNTKAKGNSRSTDAFSTFLSNINAASESVTKLFRQSSSSSSLSLSKQQLLDNAAPTNADSVSMTSMASDYRRLEALDLEVQDVSSPSLDEASQTYPTPSTVAIGDVLSMVSDDVEISNKAENIDIEREVVGSEQVKRVIRNPFIGASSPLEQSGNHLCNQFAATQISHIGSLYEQTLIAYTARLICSRFLLTGSPRGLYDDIIVRISMKNTTLNILAQCLRINPTIFEMPIKLMQSKNVNTNKKEGFSESEDRCLQNSKPQISNIGQRFDSPYFEQFNKWVFAEQDKRQTMESSVASAKLKEFNKTIEEPMLLEIKDDHFGKSSTDFIFDSTMSRSAEPISFHEQKSINTKPVFNELDILSVSDTAIRSPTAATTKETDCLPPRPPRRMKSLRKTEKSYLNEKPSAKKSIESKYDQKISDVLYFYNHDDPLIRAGIQNIIGNFLQSTRAGIGIKIAINLQYLLAIICRGLEDDIHTVVIQAMNAFDKIFAFVITRYLTALPCNSGNFQQTKVVSQQQQTASCTNVEQKSNDYQTSFNANKDNKGNGGNNSNCHVVGDAIRKDSDIAFSSSTTPSSMCSCRTSTNLQTASTVEQTTKHQPISSCWILNDELINGILENFQLMPNNSSQGLQHQDVTATSSNSQNDKLIDNMGSGNKKGSLLIKQQLLNVLNCQCCCTHSLLTPKVLLNKLRLCYYNKYWLVQNKYAEVVANLDFPLLLTYYNNCSLIDGREGNSFTPVLDSYDNNDYITNLKNSFMEELFQLLCDNDVRVRENAAKHLYRFIIRNSTKSTKSIQLQNAYITSYNKHHDSTNNDNLNANNLDNDNDDDDDGDNKNYEHLADSNNHIVDDILLTTSYHSNFHLIMNLFDYSIFSSLSSSMRYVLNGTNCFNDISQSAFATYGMIVGDELLSQLFYQMTNALINLKDKNIQFGIVYGLKVLMEQFPLTDYYYVWSEFNFTEILVKLSQYNYATVLDLTCHADLIDVTSKLIAASYIFNDDLEKNRIMNWHLLQHCMKLINIYHHLFTEHTPIISQKSPRVEMFVNIKELLGMQQIGYFASESIYMRLYQNLKCAYDNYRITINEESGSKLISLLKSGLLGLSTTIELLEYRNGCQARNPDSMGDDMLPVITVARSENDARKITRILTEHSPKHGQTGLSLPAVIVLKLIEESLQYLAKVINYAPIECVACLKQLLKCLFICNYGNKQQHYQTFIKTYFKVKTNRLQCMQPTAVNCSPTAHKGASGKPKPTNYHNDSVSVGNKVTGKVNDKPIEKLVLPTARLDSSYSTDDELSRLLAELLTEGYNFHAFKLDAATDLSKHIELFEPLVVYCLTLLLKANSRTQAAILELLILLLEFNVTYSVLDSKNIIFNHIQKGLDIIESGVARHSVYSIQAMIRFLMKLSIKTESNIISIPKIINITNNLLANSNIRDTAIIALKTLSYELYFMTANDAFDKIKWRSTFLDNYSTIRSRLPVSNATNNYDGESAIKHSSHPSINNNELDTLREVVLGMLEKFIEFPECQQVISLLLLMENLKNQIPKQSPTANNSTPVMTTSSNSTLEADVMCGIFCLSLSSASLKVHNWQDYHLLNGFFRTNCHHLLASSKNFHYLLNHLLNADATNFSDLSHLVIILSNVILKTEEIYLVNHIKLYLRNHPTAMDSLQQLSQQQTAQISATTQHSNYNMPSTSSAAVAAAAATASAAAAELYGQTDVMNELEIFARVLCNQLDSCLNLLIAQQQTTTLNFNRAFAGQYHHLATYFIHILYKLCCKSRQNGSLFSYIGQYLRELSEKTDLLNRFFTLLTMPTVGQGIPQSTLMAPNLMAATTAAISCGECDGSWHPLFPFCLEMFDLLFAVKLLPLEMLLQRLLQPDVSTVAQHLYLHKICQRFDSSCMIWKRQQVQQLLLNASFLNILLVEQLVFVYNLCKLYEEFWKLFRTQLVDNMQILDKYSLVRLLHLMEGLCGCKSSTSSIASRVEILNILCKMHEAMSTQSQLQSSSNGLPSMPSLVLSHQALMVQIERLACHLINDGAMMSDKNTIYHEFLHLRKVHRAGEQCDDQLLLAVRQGQQLRLTAATTHRGLEFMILNDLENSSRITNNSNIHLTTSDIISEEWMFNQLIDFTMLSHSDAEQVVKILLEIQSENKLLQIVNHGKFNVENILPHAIATSLQAMLHVFRNNCMQYNPHIHYMQPNPLVRVSLALLLTRITNEIEILHHQQDGQQNGQQERQQKHQHPVDQHPQHQQPPSGNTVKVNEQLVERQVGSIGKDQHYDESETAIVITADGQVEGKLYLYDAVIALMEGIQQIESNALIYIEAKFIEKFVNEHLLPNSTIAKLVKWLQLCCQRIYQLLHHHHKRYDPCKHQCLLSQLQKQEIHKIFQCLNVLLQQQRIWHLLNQGNQKEILGDYSYPEANVFPTDTHNIMNVLLDVIYQTLMLQLQNTFFYKKYQNKIYGWASNAAKATFLAELIEKTTQNTCTSSSSTLSFTSCLSHPYGGNRELANIEFTNYLPLDVLLSVGTLILRSHLFYAIAVTPYTVMIAQQQQLQQQQGSNNENDSKLFQSLTIKQASTPTSTSTSAAIPSPTTRIAPGKAIGNSSLAIIPIDSLSDVDILQSLVKRLSIFGFTTRQQFEEYFMTFLLLINKVYEEQMVDQSEQFQIRSICLEAIMELLIIYKTYPIVGNRASCHHHTIRLLRLGCDSISTRKLHEIQLIVSGCNVFYHPNLERSLLNDSVIGTKDFAINQYDLNFLWQQMDANNSQPMNLSEQYSNSTFNHVVHENFLYFTQLSGVDFKSSSQLIFDVLMEMLMQNYVLTLPSLVKFVEICENREQIKRIAEKVARLQLQIPYEDLTSHQCLIYILCKAQAMLVPLISDLQHIEILLRHYLKSKHSFIRCATLNGLLCLLESCYRTSTAIGKLSSELKTLKVIAVQYLDKYIDGKDESWIHSSDWHQKLVWTLNYCLIEWTSKLDRNCHLPIRINRAASKLLKQSTNEHIYLCTLHGLERLIILGRRVISEGDYQQVHCNTEKLALELVKIENEKYSIPAMKLLLSCIYMGSSLQLESTEQSNGIVQDDPEIIAQQTDKVDILLQCLKNATRGAAWIYGQVLCQIIRDLVPPIEILTKVTKELLVINQPHDDVIAIIVFQVFRSAIASSFLQQLQDWLICSLPTFLALDVSKAVWSLTVVFLAASINLHLIRLFPLCLQHACDYSHSSLPATAGNCLDLLQLTKLQHHQIALFITAARDFYQKLNNKQQQQLFSDAFRPFKHIDIYNRMLQSLHINQNQ